MAGTRPISGYPSPIMVAIEPGTSTGPSVPGTTLRGLLMGTADVVPGISGGTVAMVLGIYGTLIANIRAVSRIPLAARAGWTGVRAASGQVQWRFVLPLGCGMASAIVVGAFTIEPLIEARPQQMRALFAGLVVASLIVPFGAIRRWTPGRIGLAAAGVVAAFLLTGLPPTEVDDPALWAVFAAASIAICAMILPGVSGSFVLATMGLYTTSLAALRELDVAYIAVFVAGAAIGLALFSKVLQHLLVTHGDSTMALLCGLMVGALRALWPWQGEDRTLLTPTDELGVVVLCFVAGAAVVSGLILLSRRRARP